MEKSVHWHGRKNPSFSSSLLDAIYRSFDESDSAHSLSSSSKTQIASSDRKRITTPKPPVNLRHRTSTSTSSDSSTFDRFSSSDADSTSRRSDPKRPISISSRFRDLRNPRSPSSPGARVAAFLNAIFAGGGGKLKKPKASSKGDRKRSVCFSPVSVTAGGGCGERRRCGEFPVRVAVEELMRGLDLEEEEEAGSDCESVSSSELFELPVYETTDLRANRAIARGFIV